MPVLHVREISCEISAFCIKGKERQRGSQKAELGDAQPLMLCWQWMPSEQLLCSALSASVCVSCVREAMRVSRVVQVPCKD